ncbi:hypothetical protein D9M72_478130 [compost metagenome]
MEQPGARQEGLVKAGQDRWKTEGKVDAPEGEEHPDSGDRKISARQDDQPGPSGE